MSKEKQIWEQPGYDFDPPYPASTPVITNYDRLISKTPEELAEFICKTIMAGVKLVFPGSFYSKADIVELNNDWLSWLKSPADKEESQ